MNANSQPANQSYKPISCDFYDELEAAATLKEDCEIVYTDENGQSQAIKSRIVDLYTQEHVEYARLEGGRVIRLDQLVSMNGKSAGTPADRQPTNNGFDEKRFYEATEAYELASTEYYGLHVDRLQNRLELTAKQYWNDPEVVAELGTHLRQLARHLNPGFTFLNDLSALTPDDQGTVHVPPVPGRGELLRAGLVRVADLIPAGGQTLVHGQESFSVNSVKMRAFPDRHSAENWLSSAQH